jgi:hypothetical protein
MSSPQFEPRIVDVPLSKLRTDGGVSIRAELDAEHQADVRQAVAAGEVRDPLKAVLDSNGDYWVFAGFYRTEAYRALWEDAGHHRFGVVKVEVRPGTLRDAKLLAVGENYDHGLKRTSQDIEIAVGRLVADPEWGHWSNREIGRRVHVSPETVRKYRDRITPPTADTTRTMERGGAVFQMRLGQLADAPADRGAGRRLPDVDHGNLEDEERAEDARRAAAKRKAEPRPFTCRVSIPTDLAGPLQALANRMGVDVAAVVLKATRAYVRRKRVKAKRRRPALAG